MENEYIEEQKYLRAQKKIKRIKGFYWHLFWYLAVNIFIWRSIFMDLDATESFFQYGHFFTAFFWGIGLFFNWLGVFGKNIMFTKDWEDRKVKEYMDKDTFDY
jgi:hypothetical protein